MTPNNAIFRKVMSICKKNARSFDYLPKGDEKYPFIFVGNVNSEDENNSDLIGVSNVDLDVYGLRSDRNTLDVIQMSLNNEFIRLDEAFNYNVRVTRIVADVRPDNTDTQPLLRVMFRLTIEYTKKER